MTAIFAASSMTAVPSLPGGLSNHTGHFIGYALLAALVIRAFAGAAWHGVTASAALKAVLFASAYGVTDEFHQRFVPNRTSAVDDWVADTIGAVAGVLIVLVVARRARRARGRADGTRSV